MTTNTYKATDKPMNALDNEAFLQRWKKGIEAITPFQQARITYFNTYIMIIGILSGIIFSALSYENLWWLGIILVAALVNTIVVQLGNYQRYNALRNLEIELEGGEK